MKKVYTLLLIMVFISVDHLRAQVMPPTLQAGIGTVTALKGTLDIDLIASLIQEKQNEVKKEIVKRQMYGLMRDENYTLFEFGYNTLDVLTTSADKKAIQRKILESSANLALVYGFSEAYASTSIKMGNTELYNWLTEYSKGNSDLVKSVQSLKDNRRLPSGNLFGLEAFANLPRKSKDGPVISSILVDMIYDILVKEKVFEQLGFLQNVQAIDQHFYSQSNAYLKYIEEIKGDSVELKCIDVLYNRIAAEAKLLSKGYYLIKLLSESGGATLLSALNGKDKDSLLIAIDELSKLRNEKDSITVRSRVFISSNNEFKYSLSVTDTVKDTIVSKATAIKMLWNLYTNQQSLNLETHEGPLKTMFNSINSFKNDSLLLQKLTNNDSLLLKDLNEMILYYSSSDYRILSAIDLWYLHTKVLPVLTQLSMKYGLGKEAVNNILQESKSLQKFLIIRTITTILNDTNITDNYIKLPVSNYGDFLKLISTLHELGKAPTYSKVSALIANVKAILPTGKAQQSIALLTGLIERYTEVNMDSNYVKVNVEEILLQLENRFSNSDKRPLEFYLSVGLNQTTRIWYKDGYEIFEQDTSGVTLTSPLSSLGFVSEKIGIKCKIVDIKRIRNDFIKEQRCKKDIDKKYKFKSKEPIISDFHGIVYGSGILYNLVNLKTSRNFDYILVGAGVGCSFYNGLDVNLFYNIPMVAGENLDVAWNRRQMYGISFDIKFGEYIMAYRKKMAEKKANKTE